MVVPFAAGGPMDALARILRRTFTESLGKQIIIDSGPAASAA